MGKKHCILNYQTKEYFVIDDIKRSVKKIMFEDIEYAVDSTENYILYESSDEKAICCDIFSGEVLCQKQIIDHEIVGMLNSQLIFENKDKGCKYVLYDIYEKTQRAYDIIYYIEESIGCGAEINVVSTEFLDDMAYILVYVKWVDGKRQSYIFVYNIVTRILEKNLIHDGGNLIPFDLWFSEIENLFYVIFYSDQGGFVLYKIGRDFKIEKPYCVSISGKLSQDMICDYAESEEKIFVAMSTEDNEQYLIIVNKGSPDIMVVLVSKQDIWGLALFYLNNNVLLKMTEYSDKYGDREFFYLYDEKGQILKEARNIEKLLSSYSILEDEKNRDKILVAGKRAEINVEYQLDFLPKSFIKINKGEEGIHLFNESFIDKKQEIDHIVIGEQGVFLIETKNIGGSLYIDREGIWSREKEGEREIIENPDGQVQRHHNLVQSILNIDEIFDIICIANKKTDIIGGENSRIPIIRSDRILGYIQDYKNDTGRIFSERERRIIEEMIEEHRIYT